MATQEAPSAVLEELLALERKGAEIRGFRIVETVPDDHPDYLEVTYTGLCTSVMAKLGYAFLHEDENGVRVGSMPFTEDRIND